MVGIEMILYAGLGVGTVIGGVLLVLLRFNKITSPGFLKTHQDTQHEEVMGRLDDIEGDIEDTQDVLLDVAEEVGGNQAACNAAEQLNAEHHEDIFTD